ncbi:MAG TPA: SAM-dependent methyltransferase [Candidatus Polarisedimenticolia bacterium]|jgi:SAM-dependent MidA family methyltransferase|nr:SAM-dependent methyltransferase [Candidatus Polarisedimenticolia bacterium]
MAASDTRDRLEAEIAAEIAGRGPIPFARFMEMCLYHPTHGYYTRGLGGGGGRDYLTSSGLHRAFGALIARQAEEMWRRTGRPDPYLFVEFGPGEGHFAWDFLQEAARHDGFLRALRYLMVEPSRALRDRQRARLGGRGAAPVSWLTEPELDARAKFAGCLFANEVLDAFPVHRVVGTPDGPREIHVASRDGRLEEITGPLSSDALGRFLADSEITLEDGQEVDLNLAAPCWVAWAAGLLQRGHMVLVDYGYEARDLYVPARPRGTLLAYHRHRVNEEFLLRPGEQDLTAHVDFTAVKRAAETAGARLLGLTTQSRFLLALGALDFLAVPAAVAAGGPGQVPVPVARRVEAIEEREALKDLVLPGGMGDRFKVLVLGVGEVTRDLTGLSRPWAGTLEAAAATPLPPPRGAAAEDAEDRS